LNKIKPYLIIILIQIILRILKQNIIVINNKFHIKKNHNENNHFSKSIDNKNVKKLVSISINIQLTYNEAINCKNKEYWKNAINNELNNLYDNNIMTYVRNIPKGQNIISTKWVFTTKTDEDNNIIKFKARLVARGFSQKEGVDFDLTYSPTLNLDCIKLILFIAAKFKWNVQQLDIKAAYLNADLDKNIYVSIPPGDKNYKNSFWLLNKALYGLKQSGLQWNIKITNFLINNGFTQLNSEKCIFKKVEKEILIAIIGIYEDDMIITGYDNEIFSIINKIKRKFKISKCEPIKYILGIKIEKIKDKFIIFQKGFIKKLLEKFDIKYAKRNNTPCMGNNLISVNKDPFNKTIYKSAIGSLIFLAKCTRPDITYAVHKAARKSENPCVSDWKAVTNIMKYLNNTIEYKLYYDGIGTITVYSDADFAGDIVNRKSTSGFIIMLRKLHLIWSSKKQSTVATSTSEAEYISTAEWLKTILWLRNILYELLKFNKTITIYTDNLASKTSIENRELNTKLKHIDIKYHFSKDYIEKKIIKLEYIDSQNMLADIFTKDLGGKKILNFSNIIFIS